MAKVVSPIAAKIEVIGRPRESSYEAGKFYYPTLFIDLSQPEGAEAAKIWKNLSEDEVSQIQKGDRVQLISVGKDKSGKDKHNIVLVNDNSPAAVKSSADDTPPASEWTPDQKRAIASFVEDQADLLGFCLKVSREKFANPQNPLVETEESIRTLATSLYITTQRKFHVS
jgi:hypothetical protein